MALSTISPTLCYITVMWVLLTFVSELVVLNHVRIDFGQHILYIFRKIVEQCDALCWWLKRCVVVNFRAYVIYSSHVGLPHIFSKYWSGVTCAMILSSQSCTFVVKMLSNVIRLVLKKLGVAVHEAFVIYCSHFFFFFFFLYKHIYGLHTAHQVPRDAFQMSCGSSPQFYHNSMYMKTDAYLICRRSFHIFETCEDY